MPPRSAFPVIAFGTSLLAGCWVCNGSDTGADSGPTGPGEDSPADSGGVDSADTGDPKETDTHEPETPTIAPVELYSLDDNGQFGFRAEVAGDVDGDGRTDLIVGDPYRDEEKFPGGSALIGGAYLLLGPMTASREVTSADLVSEILPQMTDTPVIGLSVGGIGDLDDDGLDEYFIQTWEATYWLDGAPPGDHVIHGQTDWTTSSLAALAAPGDLTGDGVDDLLLAGSDLSSGDNGIYLYSRDPIGAVGVEDADVVLRNDWQRGVYSAVGPGDIDGDGRPDLVASSAYEDAPDGTETAGSVRLVLGPVADGVLSDADTELHGLYSEAYAGVNLAEVGDVDGDGRADVLVAGQYEAWLLYGSAHATWGLESADATFTATDWTHVYDINRRSGGAGDLDEDDLDDVVIAAEGAGRAWVFMGPVSGSLTVDDAEYTVGVDGNGGPPVPTRPCRDLTGDGIDDLVLGDRFGGPDQVGAVWIWPGSAEEW